MLMSCTVVDAILASVHRSFLAACKLCGLYLTLQARLVVEQQKLQKRLKHALKIHHMRPKTTVDTMTVAEKVASALDRIAEVRPKTAG